MWQPEEWRQNIFDGCGTLRLMADPTSLDEEFLRTWIGQQQPDRADRATLIRAVLDVANRDDIELSLEALSAAVVMLHGARSELDRLELDLMRAASDNGHNWALIAQVFGYRSKQAAHARASSLFHRLDVRTQSTEDER